VSVREFTKGGEDYHAKITEMYIKDRVLQEQMKIEFTENPEEFRERMMQIEATAHGMRKSDDGYLDTGTYKQATEIQIEKLTEATDGAMLRMNPKIAEHNLQYKDGFFIPLNFKELIEKIEGENRISG